MARQGLPKKYAKMGFAKGWKAYKASKRKRSNPKRSKPKRKTSTKRTARKRSNNPKRSIAGMPKKRRRVSARNVGMKIGRAASWGGAAVGGAVGSAAIIRALPLATDQGKAWAQTALGVLTMIFSPKKQPVIRAMGAGATVAGGLAVTKQIVDVPLLSGYDYSDRRLSAVKYRPRRISGGYRGSANLKAANPAATSYQTGMSRMGVNVLPSARMGMNFSKPQQPGVYGGGYKSSKANY